MPSRNSGVDLTRLGGILTADGGKLRNYLEARDPFLDSRLQVDTGSSRGELSFEFILPWQGTVPGEGLAYPDELGGRFSKAARSSAQYGRVLGARARIGNLILCG